MLTEEQQKIADKITTDVRRKDVQTLSGFAGTGKTTIVRYLLDRLPRFAVCAFTGKAAHVLREKGVGSAATIHSLIYVPEPQEDGSVLFFKRDMVDHDGFIVDESSMVNAEMDRDLRSFGLPVIYVGDHGQLEPVGPNPGVMLKPDYVLETVHRNAGEIAHFAEWIRLGKNPDHFPTEGKVTIIPASRHRAALESGNMLSNADQVICAFNATRQDVNRRVRAFRGLEGTVQVGDRVMCLRNNKKLGLFNGMQGVVTRHRRGNVFDISTEIAVFEKVHYHPDVFGSERLSPDLDLKGDNPFDFCYCITAHKAQGGEFDSVLVLEQVCKHWDHRKWSYTAASRAKRQLTWISCFR